MKRNSKQKIQFMRCVLGEYSRHYNVVGMRDLAEAKANDASQTLVSPPA